jgi:myo-inositol 2-dehydrogenase/D-chiro-inositol 1-dehydrogenase
MRAGPIRVGVIGTGMMGADHARRLDGSIAGAVVSAVADVDIGRASRVAGGLVDARVAADALELIAADDVDAVVVASADETHEAFALACLAAGKPLLCEKPLAPTAPAALRILEAEQELDAPMISIGFMRRFDPGFVELKAALGAGSVGAPLVVHCIHRNAGAVAGVTAAEVVTSSAIHEIDTARWLLDEEIVAITAHAPHHRRRPESAPDPLLVRIESESGTIVDVEVFVDASYGYDVRCEVVGETGAISLDAPGATTLRLGGRRSESLAADWRPRFSEAYRRELQDWVVAVRTGTPSGAANTRDGYLATVVAEAAVESLSTGARVMVAGVETGRPRSAG